MIASKKNIDFKLDLMKINKKDIEHYKKELDERQMEQKDLAIELDFSENTISTAFKGKDVRITTIRKIAEFFGDELPEYAPIVRKKK